MFGIMSGIIAGLRRLGDGGMGSSRRQMRQLQDKIGGLGSAVQGVTPNEQGVLSTTGMSAGEGWDIPGMLEGAARTGVDTLIGGSTDALARQIVKDLTGSNRSASERGKDTRDYLAAAYPELNPWERAGTGGTMMGAQGAQVDSQKEMLDAQLKNQKDIAKINADVQKENAQLAAVTSRANTRDQVDPTLQMLPYQMEEAYSRIEKIRADTDKSYQEKKNLIAQEVSTYAQAHNLRLTSGQIMMQTEQLIAGTEESRERLRLMSTTQSPVGKVGHDVVEGLGWLGGLAGQQWDEFKEWNNTYQPKDTSDSRR